MIDFASKDIARMEELRAIKCTEKKISTLRA